MRSLLEKLKDIVGDDRVSDAADVLENYAFDKSLAPAGKLSFVVWPSTTEEVQKIVRLCNDENAPIVPRSSGVGFTGSAIPSQGGLVMDMCRMNRIIEIDPRNRKARVEPGVTYGQLQAALAPYRMRCLNPLLPHSETSVLSSHLERDPMLIPKHEYGDPVLTMEIVLPNGDIFRTGSASSPGAPEDTISDLTGTHGPGLNFNQVFQGAQGTLGIVTWMAIKVEHLSEVERLFFIPFKNLEDVVKPIYQIQRIMLGNECLLLDNKYLASILAKNGDFKNLKDDLSPWTLALCLSGSPRRPEEKVEYEEEALFEIGKEFGLDISAEVPGAKGLESKIGDWLRQPWPDNATYWRLRTMGACAPVCFNAQLHRVPEFMHTVCDHVAEAGYPLQQMGVYIQPLDRARACFCEYGLGYDPANLEETNLIKGLYTSLSRLLYDRGALFTRPYGSQADIVYEGNAALTNTLWKLKNIFDPNNIMNPGKLCF